MSGLNLIETNAQYPLHTLGGFEIGKLPFNTKVLMANQIMSLLTPHVVAGHMVEQTIPGLVNYMDNGLAVITVKSDWEVLGFVKLYPYLSDNDGPALGYEFSSWVSVQKGVGLNILNKSIKVFKEQNNPNAGFFAVCSSDNDTPQRILFKAGGTNMERPPYVPNMLTVQTGKEHPETIINLKTIPD